MPMLDNFNFTIEFTDKAGQLIEELAAFCEPKALNIRDIYQTPQAIGSTGRFTIEFVDTTARLLALEYLKRNNVCVTITRCNMVQTKFFSCRVTEIELANLHPRQAGSGVTHVTCSFLHFETTKYNANQY